MVPVTVFIFVATCFVLNVTPVESQEWYSKKYPGSKKKFYIETSQKVSWQSALFQCMRNNSVLANIESADEHQEMINLIENSDRPNGRYWLGGNDWANEGRWVWSQGQEIKGFTFWAPNEPSGEPEEDCLVVWKEWSYDWNDWKCSLSYYYICEYRTEIRSDWPPAGAGNKKFYLESKNKADWHSAYMHCLRNNSRLARIENKEENDIVVAMIKQANLGFDLEYWLGAMDFPEVGQYFWLATGFQVKGYTNWHSGQGMGEDQRCLTYWQSSQYVVKWNDFICSTLYPFVCEYYD